MRLLPYNGKIISGSIVFRGRDLVKAPDMRIRKIRWKEISIIFQGAMNSLNPVRNIGQQIAEPIILHEKVEEDEAMKRVGELLELVGINRDRRRDFPHEFSGGMRQRVMIAMALACNPKLVIADEPSLINPPTGCVFHPRCKFAFDRCIAAEPALADVTPGRRAACFLYPEVSEVPPRTITMEVH